MTKEETSKLRKASISYQKALQSGNMRFLCEIGNPVTSWKLAIPRLQEAIQLTPTDDMLPHFSEGFAEAPFKEELFEPRRNLRMRLAHTLCKIASEQGRRMHGYHSPPLSAEDTQAITEEIHSQYEEAFAIWQRIAPFSMEAANCPNPKGSRQNSSDTALKKLETMCRIIDEAAPLSVEAVACWDSLACQYKHQERWEEAQVATDKVLTLLPLLTPGSGRGEKRSWYYHLETPNWDLSEKEITEASQYDTLGMHYRFTGDMKRAWANFAEAYFIHCERDPTSFETARSLCYLGEVYLTQQRFQEAIGKYHEALTILVQVEAEGGQAARARSEQGKAYQGREKWEQAHFYFLQAYETYHKLAPLSWETSRVLTQLGTVCSTMGRWPEALEWYEQAYRTGSALQPQSIEVAHNLNDLGKAYQALGRHEESLNCHEAAYKILDKVNPSSPYLAETLRQIGIVQRTRRNYAQALMAFRKAYWLQHALDSQEITDDLQFLAETYQDMGLCEEAIYLYDRLYHLCRYSGERGEDKLPAVLNKIFLLYEELGRLEEAVAKYREV